MLVSFTGVYPPNKNPKAPYTEASTNCAEADASQVPEEERFSKATLEDKKKVLLTFFIDGIFRGRPFHGNKALIWD